MGLYSSLTCTDSSAAMQVHFGRASADWCARAELGLFFSFCAASLALNSLQNCTLSCRSWEARSQINKADLGKSLKIYSGLLYQKKIVTGCKFDKNVKRGWDWGTLMSKSLLSMGDRYINTWQLSLIEESGKMPFLCWNVVSWTSEVVCTYFWGW